jgi:hypothetical protein
MSIVLEDSATISGDFAWVASMEEALAELLDDLSQLLGVLTDDLTRLF